MVGNPLAKYLQRHGISQNKFGARIGTSGAMVCRYVNGTRIPENRYALSIEKETGGEVPAAYWAKLQEQRARRRAATT